MERKFKTWQDKTLAYSFYPLLTIAGWISAGWAGVLIGIFIASQIKLLFPRWDFGLSLELVDRAMGNMQLADNIRCTYCLDFGGKKRLFIYRDNRRHGETVRICLLLNEDIWAEVPVRDNAFKNKAGIGTIWGCFDKKRCLTALFPSGKKIDRRREMITMLQSILEIYSLDISYAWGKVYCVHPEIDKKLYAAEGVLRAVLVRHNTWAISHDREGKFWIETLPRNSIDYHFRALTQKELKRYKYEGETFLETLPDDCVRREDSK
jgi:hypothetical protein